jgi:anti-sigma B factor antagonist
MAVTRLRVCGAVDQGVVTFRGALDVVNAASAAKRVTAATAGGGWVVVDLAAVEFIDCHALGALVRARKLARRAGGDLVLASPREPVRRLLDLTGLAGMFSVYVSAAAAAAAARPGALRGGPRSAPHYRGGPPR